MYRYKLWVRLNAYQTTETIIMATDDISAKMLGEAQFGAGNVLNYTRLYD